MPLATPSQQTLRPVVASSDDPATLDNGVDVVDLCAGGNVPSDAQTLTVRWRKVARRVRFPPNLSVDAAIAMLVHRLGRDGKRRDPGTLVLVRRHHDDAGAVMFDALEPRSAPVSQFGLSDAAGDQLLLSVRKCAECQKMRIAACVTNQATGVRMFLCRQCATVAGVKQLKVQQMILVGQIGQLETKMKQTKSNAQLKKLADALRLAKAHHRGIQEDILAMTPDLPKLTTVPVELKRSDSGRASEPPKVSPTMSPVASPTLSTRNAMKDEADLSPASTSPVNTPP